MRRNSKEEKKGLGKKQCQTSKHQGKRTPGEKLVHRYWRAKKRNWSKKRKPTLLTYRVKGKNRR